MITPQECDNEDCDKTFCLSCISETLKCPSCQSSKYHACSKGIRSLLSNLEIWCSVEGCGQKTKYDSYTNHVSNCPAKIETCESCQAQIKKGDLEQHKKDNCGKESKEELDEATSHLENKKEMKLEGNDLETINKNIERVVKDQEDKFSKIESVNQMMNKDLKEKLKLFVEKVGKSKKSQTNESKGIDIELIVSEFGNRIVESVTEKLNFSEINVDIGEKFQNFLQNSDNSKEFEVELVKAMQNQLKVTELNLINSLESVKNHILKETNSIILSNFQNSKKGLEEKNELSSYELNLIKSSVNSINENEQKNSELLEKIALNQASETQFDPSASINLNQLTMSLNQKILESLDKKINELRGKFSLVSVSLSENLQEQVEKIKSTIQLINSQSKELKTYINENVGEINTNFNNLMGKILKEISEKIAKTEPKFLSSLQTTIQKETVSLDFQVLIRHPP
jgi:hypothetical protein